MGPMAAPTRGHGLANNHEGRAPAAAKRYQRLNDGGANVAGSIFLDPARDLPGRSPTAEAMGLIDKPASLHFFDAASMIAVACCTMRVSEPRNFDDSASGGAVLADDRQAEVSDRRRHGVAGPLNVFFNSLHHAAHTSGLAIGHAVGAFPRLPSASAWMAHPDSTAPSLMASFILSMDLPDLLARICRACTPLSDSDHISSKGHLPLGLHLAEGGGDGANPSWPLRTRPPRRRRR